MSFHFRHTALFKGVQIYELIVNWIKKIFKVSLIFFLKGLSPFQSINVQTPKTESEGNHLIFLGIMEQEETVLQSY